METKIKETKIEFDAVKTMREIRDKFSREIMNMDYEQERAYLNKILSPEKKRQAKGVSHLS